VLVSSTRHVNVLVAVIVSIKDEYSSILMGGGRTRHVRQAPFREPGVVALEKHLCRTARVSSNTNIIWSVTIQIADRQRRTVVGKLMGQSRLNIEVHGLIIRMTIVHSA